MRMLMKMKNVINKIMINKKKIKINYLIYIIIIIKINNCLLILRYKIMIKKMKKIDFTIFFFKHNYKFYFYYDT